MNTGSTSHTPKLDAALLAAQAALGPIARSSHNAFAAYDYVDADTMVRVCRDALHAHGVLLTLDHMRLRCNGTQLVTHWRLSGHGESRASCAVWPVVEGKGKPADKATAGALTMALREFLRVNLLVPRGDDEPDARDDRDHVPAPKLKTPPPSQAKPIAIPPAESPFDPFEVMSLLAKAKEGDRMAWEDATQALKGMSKADRKQFEAPYTAAKEALAKLPREPGEEG